MSLFPAVKYNNIQGWIPESDIDGVDAGTTFLSEAINVDIDNGFLKAAVAPTLVSNPTNIASAVSAGYSIISSRKFVHSTRGNCQFYVLYKFSSPNYYLRFFIVDSTYTTGLELNIDEQNSSIAGATGADAVTIGGAPSNVNYSIANDQLKISLNCTGTYTLIPETVTLNLTLAYLSASIYVTSSVERAAGWYLFPRWLGFTYDSVDDVKIYASTNNIQLVENCGDISPESWISSIYNITMGIGATWVIDNPALTVGNVTTVTMRNIKDIVVVGDSDSASDTLTCTVYDPISGAIISQETVSEFTSYTFELNLVGSYYIVLQIRGNFIIDSITVNGFATTDYCILAKYSDGQRALISSSSCILADLINTMYLTLNTDCLDWRVSSYEIYVQINSVFYLASEVTVASWSTGALGVEKAITWTDTADLATTLNFNYGLGATVRVDNQRNIYSECAHRNRTYTVNGDYRVYQSHISGTGRYQPDSFPYSTTEYYGFFELAYQERAIALAVSPLDELVVFTDKNSYVYYIQLGQGIAFKKLKAINGDVGISSRTSLIRDLDGTPSGEVLAWVDLNGIYIYGGGTDAPINIAIKGGIRNAWRTVMSGGTTIYGLYNPMKKELWFCYTGVANVGMVYVYELEYGRFRKYTFASTIRIAEFSGMQSNILYWVTAAGTIYSYDYSGSTKLAFEFATHYHTGMVTYNGRPLRLEEEDYKILQEIFLNVKDTDSTSNQDKINVDILIDNNSITTVDSITLKMLLTGYFDKIIAPKYLQYRKVKLKFTNHHADSTDATIREFGYSFSTMNRGLNQ